MKRLYNTYKDDFDPEIAKNPLILTFDDLCYEIYERQWPLPLKFIDDLCPWQVLKTFDTDVHDDLQPWHT